MSERPVVRPARTGTDRSGGRAVEAIYPLSPTQQGLLFHALASPGTYYQRIGCQLAGEVDVACFEAAWRDLLKRHAVLRTAFAWEGLDEPLQLVGRHVGLPFRYEDWRPLSADERSQRLADLLARDQRDGFPPNRAPLWRVALLRLEDELFHFSWSHHHLILDGWSGNLVLGEVFSSYRARLDGHPPRLDPPRPYREFIAWLRRRRPAGAGDFWHRRLGGLTAPTPLPGDGTGRPGAPGGFGRRRNVLPARLTRALTSLARNHRLTLNTVVQGLWALLLSRYSGNSTVVFGTTMAGRPVDLAGAERMIGLFITTLPVRVEVSEEAEAIRWLERLQAELVELVEHEHSPLVQIQRASGVPAGSPLFESLVVFENYPISQAVEESGQIFGVRAVETVDRAHYPMTLDVLLRPDGLSLDLSYDRGRFDGTAIGWLLGHFGVLAGALAADPRRRLADLPMLTAGELQALAEQDGEAVEVSSSRCVHDLFAEQARRNADRSAVVLGRHHVTYGELARRASRVAAGLAAAGVVRGSVVALLAERGPELLAGVLGILQAGAAHLPLDPEHPPARLAGVLGRSRAPVTVVQAAHRHLLPAGGGTTVLLLEELLERPSDAPGPVAEVGAEDLAYVIYTSGSTGVPKGAMVEHRGLLNHLHAKLRDLGLHGGDVVAQNASQSFDISVWQLLAALVAGGRVQVFDTPTARDPLRLLAAVEERRVTVLETVPSLLRAVLDAGVLDGATAAPALRWLIVTGEALPADLCRRWSAIFPGVPVVNAYGPTECSDDVTHHRVERLPDEATTVPIGRAICNTQLHVVDRRGRLLPFGAAGELLVGGAGVGRGYLGDPRRSAETFVPDPFARRPGSRLYRTGDLVRRRADGSLEFLGRLDHQVKVRGFRIELGEVEEVLRRHPAISDAAVAAGDDGAGGTRLIAYPVAGPDRPAPAELRRWLLELLPDAMVPSAFVFLDRLPLNANGKLDRAALPPPDAAAAAGREHVPPRTETERALAELWREVLGGERIGADDDFFALGGHSLNATQIVSRVRRHFGVELELAELFRSTRLAELAERIDAALVAQADPEQIDQLLDVLEEAS